MEFYTADEVSKILRVRKSFVYDLIYSGRLKAIKLSARRIRIPDLSLGDFVRQEMGQASEK